VRQAWYRCGRIMRWRLDRCVDRGYESQASIASNLRLSEPRQTCCEAFQGRWGSEHEADRTFFACSSAQASPAQSVIESQGLHFDRRK